MRITASDTRARLMGRAGALIDISLSGALVELDGPVDLGLEATLELRKGIVVLTLAVRVVRQVKPRPRAQMPGGTAWPVGVTFVDLTPENRKGIPRLLGW